jgi:REP element-mobilizing transposase RayT
MELPKRKKIRLKNYDYSSPGTYFITICVKDRKAILSNIVVGASITRPKEIFSIWQKSYNDHIIRGLDDYKNIWEYIENNPLK